MPDTWVGPRETANSGPRRERQTLRCYYNAGELDPTPNTAKTAGHLEPRAATGGQGARVLASGSQALRHGGWGTVGDGGGQGPSLDIEGGGVTEQDSLLRRA